MKLEEAVEFAENPEPRCPCILLLDTSGSMSGEPIKALNEGLQTFKNDLVQNELAQKRVEVAVISFDSEVKVVEHFTTADQFEVPILTAQGLTHMGVAINQALDLLAERKSEYQDNGVAYYRPWIFLITDGSPQGETPEVIEKAVERLKEEEDKRRVAFFAVGVEGADMESLRNIVVREPVKLNGLNFTEMFIWLSNSMQRVSQSRPGEQVPLSPVGWGTIE